MNIRWYSRIIVQCVRCNNDICSYLEKCPYLLDILNELFRGKNAMHCNLNYIKTYIRQLWQHVTLVRFR